MSTKRISAYLAVFIAAVLLIPFMNSCGEKAGGKNHNQIIVKADTFFDLSKIVVKWAGEDRNFVPAYENGSDLEVIPGKSTEDNFDIYYDGDIIAGAGIKRSDESNTYAFRIGIYREKKTPYIEFRPAGPDSLNGYYIKKYVRDMIGNISREEYYNIFGHMTIQDYKNLDGQGNVKNTNRFNFQYNNEGQRIRQEHNSWNPDGELINRVVNTLSYNDIGKKSEMTYDAYNPDGSFKEANTNLYKYDGKEREYERTFISFNEDRSVIQHFITVLGYDEYSRVITESLFDRERVQINQLTRHYNEKGYIVHEEMIMYNPDGSVKETHGAYYNEKGVIIEKY